MMRPALVGIAVLGAVIAAVEIWQPLSGEGAPDAPRDREALGTAPAGEWALSEPAGAWRRLEGPGGQVVTLPGPPERIVSQTLVTDEVLLAILDDPSRVVAHAAISKDPRYSNVTEEAQRFQEVVAANAEHILSLRPDLVMMASYSSAETREQLARVGVPALTLVQFDSLASIAENIRVIGFVVGRDEQAAALVTAMEDRIEAAVARRPEGAPRPRVVLWSEGAVPARGTIFDDAATRLGAVNVPAAEAGLSGWPNVSTEQLARWDPDVIIIPAAPGEAEGIRAALLATGAVAETRAGRTGRIVTVPSAEFIAASHYIADFVERLSRILYPETGA